MNIILSPHFDDAVLSLGGLLAREGSDTVVATFFAGTPSTPLIRKWDTTCGFTDSTHAMRERTLEDKRSLNFFGINGERIRNYMHLDAQYRLTKGTPLPPESELRSSVEIEIVSLLQEFHTEHLKIFIPGFGIHTDHAVVKDAALAAIKRACADTSIEVFLYQDLPYALKILETEYPRTLWNFFTHTNMKKWNYALLQNKVTNGVFAVSQKIIPLSAADMEKKLTGVNLYTSQVAHLNENLLEKLKRFSAAQARFFMTDSPYCEVVYTLN
jgi:LmbE family N-acetylglucosaminyl deacetylase